MSASRVVMLGVLAATASLIIAVLINLSLNGDTALYEHTTSRMLGDLFGAAIAGLAGAAIIAKRPMNLIGWAFLFAGLATALVHAGSSYAGLAYTEGWPFAVESALLAELVWMPSLMLATVVVFLSFPGDRPSGKWGRGSLVLALSLATVWVLSSAVVPDLYYLEPASNPYGLGDVAATAQTLSLLALILMILASGVALIVRGFRSSGVERKQYLWLVAAVVYAVLALIASIVQSEIGGPDLGILFALAYAALPAAVVIAITRYRLYDIDRLLNRTLVYSVVIGLLMAVFVTGMLVLTNFLPFEDDLAIAASTLAVFFLFQPLRRRVQRFVDRRFNRSHYDPQRTAADLAQELRDEVDPEQVMAAWMLAVATALEPATVGGWMMESKRTQIS